MRTLLSTELKEISGAHIVEHVGVIGFEAIKVAATGFWGYRSYYAINQLAQYAAPQVIKHVDNSLTDIVFGIPIATMMSIGFYIGLTGLTTAMIGR